MTDSSLLLLPVIALLFFFLPGMATLFAFSGEKSRWRQDDVHFITSSTGLSISVTTLLLALAFLFSSASGTSFQFLPVPVILAVLTAALLVLAALRRRIPGMRPRTPLTDQATEETDGK